MLSPASVYQYYYSIKDISVGGMCICYGHAKACPLNPATKVKMLNNFSFTFSLFPCSSKYLLMMWLYQLQQILMSTIYNLLYIKLTVRACVLFNELLTEHQNPYAMSKWDYFS